MREQLAREGCADWVLLTFSGFCGGWPGIRGYVLGEDNLDCDAMEGQECAWAYTITKKGMHESDGMIRRVCVEVSHTTQAAR